MRSLPGEFSAAATAIAADGWCVLRDLLSSEGTPAEQYERLGLD